MRLGALQWRYLAHAAELRVGIVVRRSGIIGQCTRIHAALVGGSSSRCGGGSRRAYVVHRLVPRVLDYVGIAVVEGQAAAAAALDAQRAGWHTHAHTDSHAAATVMMQCGHRILFVLFACLGIVLLLGTLTLALHAEHDTGGNHGDQRHGHREDGNEHHLGIGQAIGACLRGCAELSMSMIANRGRGRGRIVRIIVALRARVSVGADALETIHTIHAGAAVVTRLTAALVDIDGTILAGKARTTRALIVVVQIRAAAAVGARFGQAEIDATAAVHPMETGHTLATILVNQVDAGAAVMTLLSDTIVNVLLALGARKAVGTDAFTVGLAAAAVLAQIRIAVVRVQFAGKAAVAGGTIALKPLLAVAARVAASALMARLVGARQQLLLAHASVPALGAYAFVATRRCLVHTGAAILARINIGIA